MATIQMLAERHLPFRGSVERNGTPHNGTFLGVIELLAKFDPIMQEHLPKTHNKEKADHYLEKRIQN